MTGKDHIIDLGLRAYGLPLNTKVFYVDRESLDNIASDIAEWTKDGAKFLGIYYKLNTECAPNGVWVELLFTEPTHV